jgi:hypothetical protein
MSLAQTAVDIDNEIRAIIDRCYGKARQILVDNRDKLDLMADALMQYETIDAAQIDAIMAGPSSRASCRLGEWLRCHGRGWLASGGRGCNGREIRQGRRVVARWCRWSALSSNAVHRAAHAALVVVMTK